MVADVSLEDRFHECRAIHPRKNAAVALLLLADDDKGRLWDCGIPKITQRR